MRLFLFVALLLCGLVTIVTGLIVPAHLRAVDPFVLENRPPGKTLPDLAAEIAAENPAAAKTLLFAAEELSLPGTEAALDVLRDTGAQPRERTVLTELEAAQAGRARVREVPVLVALRPATARERVASSLRTPEARRILENRAITNTTVFAPARSAAGYPLDSAILTTAFLVERRAFHSTLRDQVVQLTAMGSVGEIEEFYLNMLSLARRFSSAQIAALVAHVPSVSALDMLARGLQNHPDATSLLYSAVLVSRNGAGVAHYLREFPRTAIEDITLALKRGSEPLNYLLASGQPVFRSNLYPEFATDPRLRGIYQPLLNVAVKSPAGAMLLKLLLLALGAICLVAASRFTRRAVERESHYVLFPQFSLVRRGSAALVVLMLLVIFGEPYLARGSAREPDRPQISFSLAALAAPAPTLKPSSNAMLDPQTVLAIVTFLTLQGVIYGICLVKLAEIRKQPVPSATKLKLLDNEENLFDGGLYCGLFGTASSLILLTLGVIKPSLIAAYASTLFGILFVALIKIVHVRPYKRRLLLETSDLQAA